MVCGDLESLGRAGTLDQAPKLLDRLRVTVADTREAIDAVIVTYDQAR